MRLGATMTVVELPQGAPAALLAWHVSARSLKATGRGRFREWGLRERTTSIDVDRRRRQWCIVALGMS